MLKHKSLFELGVRAECCAVAAAIKIDGLHLFSAPFRCIDSNAEYVLYHAIGGRCLTNEPWIDALRRETREELDANILITPAQRTQMYNSNGACTEIEIDEQPRPVSLVSKTVHTDRSFYHSDVHWVIGYQGTITSRFVYPREEVALLVLLTDDMLVKSLCGNVTYQEIVECTDGSQVIVRDEADLNYRKLAVPAGLALIEARKLFQS